VVVMAAIRTKTSATSTAMRGIPLIATPCLRYFLVSPGPGPAVHYLNNTIV
jgi:hypothetical protein